MTTKAIIQKRPIFTNFTFLESSYCFFLQLVKIRSPLSSILRSTRTRKGEKEIEKVDTMETLDRRDVIIFDGNLENRVNIFLSCLVGSE